MAGRERLCAPSRLLSRRHHWVTAYVAANWVISLAYTLIALLIFQRMKRASHIPRTLMGNAFWAFS